MHGKGLLHDIPAIDNPHALIEGAPHAYLKLYSLHFKTLDNYTVACMYKFLHNQANFPSS